MLEEYVQHIKKVLDKLRTAELLLKSEKYNFHKNEVTFLGYIVGKDSIYMDLSKVKAILKWPVPRTVKEVQTFLRFVNFYKQFIQGYLNVVKPLIDLIKKEQKFE
jgi:hypothetical protein